MKFPFPFWSGSVAVWVLFSALLMVPKRNPTEVGFTIWDPRVAVTCAVSVAPSVSTPDAVWEVTLTTNSSGSGSGSIGSSPPAPPPDESHSTSL